MGLCVCVCVCLWVCYHDKSKLITCIDFYQTWSVGEGSDHLQLFKFWPSCAPGKGSAAGRIFGSALLQPARSVCVSLSAFFMFVAVTPMRIQTAT